jgi:hypothetical protein
MEAAAAHSEKISLPKFKWGGDGCREVKNNFTIKMNNIWDI